MPVAISFPDAVTSAAPFLNGVVRADSASGDASIAGKEVSACETCSVPKHDEQKDQDFDAVLALLISGGVRPQPAAAVVHATAVQLTAVTPTMNTKLTSVDAGSNAAGTTNRVSVAQTTIKPGNSAPQKATAPLTSARMPFTPTASRQPGNVAIADTVGTGTVEGVHYPQQAAGTEIAAGGTPDAASSAVIDAQIGIAAEKTAQSMLPSTAQLVTDDRGLASTTSSDPATANPLSQDMINALERIGRPSEVTGPIVYAAHMTHAAQVAPKSREPAAPMTDASFIETPAAIAVDPSVRTTTIPGTIERAAIPARSERTAISDPTTKISVITLPTLPPGTVPTAALVASIQANASPEKMPTAPVDTPVPVSQSTTSDAVHTEATDTVPATPSQNRADGRALAGNTAAVPSLKSAPSAATPISDPATGLGRLQPLAGTVKFRPSFDADSQMSELLISQTSATTQPAAILTSETVMSGGVLSSVANALPSPTAPDSSEMRPPLTNQISQAIMDHIEHNGVRQSDSLSVRLDPPELGEMTIELSKTPEGLAIRVTAREAVTMDMLLVRGQEIESQLRGQHMNLKSLEFQRSETSDHGSSQGQGQQQQQENNASRRSENLMNQMRSAARSLNLRGTGMARITTSESTHGLSFTA